MLFVFSIMNYQMLTRPGLRKATLMSKEGWVAKIRLSDQEQQKKPRKPNVRSSSCADAGRSQANQNIGFWNREMFIAKSLKETDGS